MHRARGFDAKVAIKITAASKSAVLPNHLNTEKHRMIKNTGRAMSRIKKAAQQHQAYTEVASVEDRLQEARARLKEAQDTVKALGAEKKQLRETTGIKTTRTLKSQKVVSDAIRDVRLTAEEDAVQVRLPLSV